MNFKFRNRDGFLYAVTESDAFSEPIRTRLWWKLARTCNVPEVLEGLPGTTWNGVCYPAETWDPLLTRWKFPLPGDKQADIVENEPIPAPKTRSKPIRYQHGEWQKLLAKGWVRV